MNTIVRELYKDVLADQIERLQDFRTTHSLTQTRIGKTTWNYLVCGKGDKTVVVLPGDERRGDLLFPLIQAWEQHYRLIYPSFPAVPTIQQLVEGLAAVLEKEQVRSINLLGVSFGGSVAQCFVRKYPQLVAKLILQNTTVPQPELAVAVRAIERVTTFMPGGTARSLLKQMLRQVVEAPQEEQAFWQAYIQELIGHHLTKKDALALLRGTIDYRQNYRFAPDDLAAWAGKVLILESQDDRPITPGMRAALKNAYPQARVETFPQGGHTPYLLHKERYLSIVEGFLDEKLPE
ncbi:alpha/beta fold hydrolase [Tengunoibacter tsumagoiensis]|uniref:AB hydrolase-1 domain-containing protein n=1 Tax=Tengunoibacter tsumagoiensis TaxID=2014871 RepID=A0A402A6V8_9CHLR|nr:alpha/beta hydrolase [Tengunoibacter tsumagoiensis]GCE14880.1 hypothetical protein KTT_47390 [Tengunoibacter tsumagoiensis]